MLEDRYGNAVSTNSPAARDAYVEALDLFLAAEAGVAPAFERALSADPNLALAHLGLARDRQMRGDGAGAKAALAEARTTGRGLTARETADIELIGMLIEGRGTAAYPLIRAHLREHPRDVFVAQTCVGVFGLIGFSGQPGREAEQLAFTASLAPHYGSDWFFLASHAWSEIETGRTAAAEGNLEAALAARPRNANAAHYRSHLHYENGETAAGYGYIRDWLGAYSRAGVLHTHIHWHVALWALEAGDEATLWRVFEEDVAPGAGAGPPLNVLADSASLLYRAELAGFSVPEGAWRATSDYAGRMFPKPGVAFADVHAALAHAMAGDGDALERLIAEAAGPAADLVRDLGAGFRALAAERWTEAAAHLTTAMRDHARIGGSRAQRDLLEFALAGALLRLGREEEARRLIALRRPVSTPPGAVKGLN